MANTVYVNGLAGYYGQNGQFTPYRQQYSQGGGNKYTPYQGNAGYGAPYSQNYNNARSNGNNGQRKKHSGAKMVVINKGNYKGTQGVSFWNYSRSGGMLSGLCVPYGKTHEVKSKTGRIWHNYMLKWQNKTTKLSGIVGCLFEPATGKVLVKDWGWTINPKAPNGGYAGRVGKKR
jgi:hypothetical protein